MASSLLATVFDILKYHRIGNYSQFDRAFTKAIQYHSVLLEEEIRKKLRNIAFRHFYSGGLIECGWTGGKTKWSVNPAVFVQLADETFTILGATKSDLETSPMRDIIKLDYPKESYYDSFLPADLSFFPRRISITCSLRDIEQVSQKVSIPISRGFQDKVFALLPSIDTVMGHSLAKESLEVFEPGFTSIYIAESNKWDSYSETRPTSGGLYKRKYRFAPAQYFIADESNRRFIQNHRVIERDWMLICFLRKTGNKFKIYCDERNHIVKILRNENELRLPPLIERCLRSGTFTAPDLSDGYFIYKGIRINNLWKMVSKLPVFEVVKI